ncbi:hypothetical protein [Kurthia sibirica]|uniref:Uncharacterized protein n=1 Tax=Kurthia sibirica TaxID=202750 RepID=A0A2U3AIU3_9BACL|nr:hypothetical protein [Kurthia sibirica]PWI24463.1 hypothetical protein DEX24_13450 [Kurthia sibirica]GEK35680.1 hypothetical protein KSI01_32130 [Kurthia sibirica]
MLVLKVILWCLVAILFYSSFKYKKSTHEKYFEKFMTKIGTGLPGGTADFFGVVVDVFFLIIDFTLGKLPWYATKIFIFLIGIIFLILVLLL